MRGIPSKEEKKEEAQVRKGNNTLFTIGMGRTPAVVEMEILGYQLSNTIVDGGSGVNILSKETWKAMGIPTLWPRTFQLVGTDQY